MSNEAGPLGMERLEDLEEYVEDILLRKTFIPTSQDIAWIASRKKFNPEREKQLISKAKTTRCKCKVFQPVGSTCMRYTCRHDIQNHNKVGLK